MTSDGKPVNAADRAHNFETQKKVCEYWGVEAPVLRIRKCMNCSKSFESRGNRICGRCHSRFREGSIEDLVNVQYQLKG